MSHNNGNISSGSAAEAEAEPQAGSLSWRLSSHPMTLLCFLSFRICTRPVPSNPAVAVAPPTIRPEADADADADAARSLHPRLSLRNALHRELVTHRPSSSPQARTHARMHACTHVHGGRSLTHHSILIFILTILLLSLDFYTLKNIAGRRLAGLRWWNEVDASTGNTRLVFESADAAVRNANATDRRFFWLALYAQPLLWVVMALVSIVKLHFVWLSLVGESLLLLPFLLLFLAFTAALLLSTVFAFARTD